MIRIIMAFTLSFSVMAVELGEDLKGNCVDGVQSSRNTSSAETSNDTSGSNAQSQSNGSVNR